jgi:hypothetical protein
MKTQMDDDYDDLGDNLILKNILNGLIRILILFFSCKFFSDAVSNSHSIASNDRIP